MKSIFELYGWDVIKSDQLHQGLINSTYSITTHHDEYILQTINHHIFKDPWAIDQNINNIGKHLANAHPNYLFTNLVPTKEGKTLVEWEGQFFRAFHKIDGYALSVLENAHQAKEAAEQFGKFTSILGDFNIQNLIITLPDFHNLSLRFHQFETSIIKGNAHRINQCKAEIKILLGLKIYVDKYEQFIQNPASKQRVTHHDTKISNVLFKQFEGQEKAICVIDLDTVMPGYFISDIGDMCRTSLCNVSEEEANLDLIQVDAQKWEALQAGYLSHMKHVLSGFELDHLFFGGQFMIYMQALRFLTDHLNNDIYYGAKKEGQNYVRALNQIRLLEVYNELY